VGSPRVLPNLEAAVARLLTEMAAADDARAAIARLLAAHATVGGQEAEAVNGPHEQLLTVEQVATLLQMDKSTVYKKARQDPRWREAARRIGPGTLRFDLSTLKRKVIRPS
jgi:hypothetical protein